MERGRISISRDAPGLIREVLRVSEVLEAPLTYEIVVEMLADQGEQPEFFAVRV